MPDPIVDNHRRIIKARLVGFGLLDLAVDIAVPLVITVILTASGLSALLALTVGGIVIGAKSALGRIEHWRADRYAAFVVVVAVCSLGALLALVTAGVPDAAAAAISSLLGMAPVVVGLVGRRVDGFGLLMLAELAAAAAVVLISDDPRFVLARPAVYTALAGGYALLTCVVGRPLMLDVTKPMAAAGDPVRATAFENAWLASPSFRAVERMMTFGLGLVLIAEAVLRVVVIYGTAEPDLAVTGLLAQVPAIGLFVVWFLLVRVLWVPRARAAVDHQVVLLREPTATPGDRGRLSP